MLKPGEGLRLSKEQARIYGPRGIRKREQANKFLVEGDSVSTRDIATRLGVSMDVARARLKRAQANEGAVTWKSLEAKT